MGIGLSAVEKTQEMVSHRQDWLLSAGSRNYVMLYLSCRLGLEATAPMTVPESQSLAAKIIGLSVLLGALAIPLLFL